MAEYKWNILSAKIPQDIDALIEKTTIGAYLSLEMKNGGVKRHLILAAGHCSDFCFVFPRRQLESVHAQNGSTSNRQGEIV